MYRLIRERGGLEIGLTERPRFIKKSSSGVFIETSEAEAQGVAYKGTAYNLQGRNGLDAAETALLIQFDAGDIGLETESVSATASITFVTLAEAGDIDDVTAGEHTDLFSPWAPDVAYKAGNLRQYDGRLYRCLLDHTSQSDWTPDVATSLWTAVADPAEEWPEWSQPIGGHDAYNEGDKVSHNGKHWISDIGSNIWEPGVYGWTEAE